MNRELQRLFDDLNHEFGDTKVSQKHGTTYKKIHKSKRRQALWSLVNTMKGRGRDRDFFENSSVQEEISEFFFPDLSFLDSTSKRQKKDERKVAVRELREILPEAYPSADLFKEVAPEQEVTERKPEKRIPVEEKESQRLGREIDHDKYQKLSNFEHQVDDEFAKLMGVTKDE